MNKIEKDIKQFVVTPNKAKELERILQGTGDEAKSSIEGIRDLRPPTQPPVKPK
ncbi:MULTISPECIES: hypothetical protein [Aliivibrio]|uniref:Uncharacterized protein n=1 Tax=Aliivibrio fischeri TaxID=668 RepID=A0A510UTP8_ALIFS|nr:MULTISPECIES: hypothetical protein [Aliivibrio]GEK16195.1 hypothetical protein AFI02nite_42310 [Aliivibrio fischeri]